MGCNPNLFKEELEPAVVTLLAHFAIGFYSAVHGL